MSQELTSTNPYTSLPQPMTEQDWRNAVGLLQMQVKELAVRLKELESFRAMRS